MSDIDEVFARLGGGRPAASEGRELRSVPRRGSAAGSRVVEVVRLPAGGARPGRDRTARPEARLRAQTWDQGFPARSAAPPSPATEPVAAHPELPVAHVMPMWEPAGDGEPIAAPVAAPVDAVERVAARAPGRRSGEARRRVADPFDTADDGANCMRCGYAIQPGRARRGLMTCAGCG
jgi:hypothetical protein